MAHARALSCTCELKHPGCPPPLAPHPARRNYNTMSLDEQEEEMARVRAFSRALFYNIRGSEDR